MSGKSVFLGALAICTVPAMAAAEPVKLKPLVDARLRWEAVGQDGPLRDADAVTARVRAGVQADAGNLSVVRKF